MIKRFLFLLLVLTSFNLAAKKVKFMVDTDTCTVDTAGMHITGDFQDEAGFAADWDPGTTGMTQDVTNPLIWWIVVDIPAFRVYQFKFVNGIFGYQQEFVPVESRVNYNFIDSRWIFIDSLANDTTAWGAIRFAGNAPDGKSLLRFYVDMANETVSPNAVHVATGMNSWSTTDARMYSFDGDVWEYITYVDSGLSVAREFKFLNGNTSGNYEALAGWCANGSGNREVIAPRDTMLPVVCYTFCAACSTVGLEDFASHNFTLAPNPALGDVQIGFEDNAERVVSVIDNTGREVVLVSSNGNQSVSLDVRNFSSGVYFVRVMETNGHVQVQKLVVE